MIRAFILAAAGAVALMGCGEREQTESGIKTDTHASVGTDRPQPFMSSGWKPGDRAGWEQHIKVRTQGGQNEYGKIN